jgi:hypothetical protein
VGETDPHPEMEKVTKMLAKVNLKNEAVDIEEEIDAIQLLPGNHYV